MSEALRLYVWRGFCPDYTDGLAFAIAENETQARELVEKANGMRVWTWGNLTVYDVAPIAECVCGGG